MVSKGFDTCVQAVLHGWELYEGYTFTTAERKYLAQARFVPLTQKHRTAFTLVKDFAATGFRAGLEGSCNGPQYRFDATKTPGCVFLAGLVGKRFEIKLSVVLNGENLLD